MGGNWTTTSRSYRLGEWKLFVYRFKKDGQADFFLNGERVGGVVDSEIPADRDHHFEGIQLGFFNDKFNHFGEKYVPFKRRSLSETREFRSLAVWEEALRDQSIANLHPSRDIPQSGLCAYLVLSEELDREGSVVDRVQGLRMRVKSVRCWE